MPGRTPLHLPALSATVLRPAFLPPNQECSIDSSGLPDPLPPSDDLDWGQLCFLCDLLLRSSTPPAHPVFPSTSPGGEGKPETFNFLGFTHICGQKRGNGRFTVLRQTI